MDGCRRVGDNVYGYYATDTDGSRGWEMNELMGSTGEMKVESRGDFDAKYTSEGVTEFTLEVTESQAAKVGDYLSNRAANPGSYSLKGDQCTSVAADALNKAGVG